MTKARTYTRTHPWLSFRIELSKIDWETWLMLGEAVSKCSHLSQIPMKPGYKEALMEVYLAKGAHATTAIEGNTLTEQEVRLRVNNRAALPPSKEYLGIEVDNILDGYKSIFHSANEVLTADSIRAYNFTVLQRLEVESHVTPGEIRKCEIVVNNYSGAPAQDCPFLLEQLVSMIHEFEKKAETSKHGMALSIVVAIVAHIYLAWIHPFGDGNGRTARLVEFKLMVDSGIPSVAAHLLSNHYNETRSEYYRQLAYASQSGGDIYQFVRYSIQGFVDGLRAQLELVWKQLWELAWRDYVHETIEGESARDSRLRRIALDLTRESSPVPSEKIPFLTPKVAQKCAQISGRTVSRDLAELVRLGLITESKQGYVSNWKSVLRFTPSGRIKKDE